MVRTPLRMWQRALIWLLLAVLPFKALAAVAMVGCGGPHGAVFDAAPQRHQHAPPHDQAAHDHAAHAHAWQDQAAPGDAPRGQAAHEHASQQTPLHDHASHDAAADADNGKTPCSSCAPCCAAAAPAFAPPALPAAAAGERAPCAASDAFIGVVCKVPHRPPRTTVA